MGIGNLMDKHQIGILRMFAVQGQDVKKYGEDFVRIFSMYQIMLRRKAQVSSHVQYMLRTGLSWNIQSAAVVFATIVASGTFWKLDVEWKIILRRVLNRNDSEQFGVHQDGISDTPQNDNRPQSLPDNREL